MYRRRIYYNAEQKAGTIPGRVHCARAFLEFAVDPASPLHKPEFAADKQYVIVLRIGRAFGTGSCVAARHGI